MCFEPRIIFACGCEKPKNENSQQRLCEWASMGGTPCSGTMVGADPWESRECMYECLECQKWKGLPAGSRKGARSKLSEMKKKLKK